MVTSAIYGCAGTQLTADEHAFFHAADPWGFILFRRNCETADQVRALCAELRSCVGRDAPILVDHEGGRVSRLSPHIVPKRPPAGILDALARTSGLGPASSAAAMFGELLARDARALGITVNCVPMVDVRHPDADNIVGDRALGEAPDAVIALGRAVAQGTMRGGCLPVVKHIPGHGRALVDSHKELPRVNASLDTLQEVDFAPFKALADLPLGMTAHIVYEAIDPDLPATLSSTVIKNRVRGAIGFDGLLMTDDLSMEALTGSYRDRAAASLAAGCDLVLHCNGDLDEMQGVAEGTAPLTPDAERRSQRALAQLEPERGGTLASLEARFATATNAVNQIL